MSTEHLWRRLKSPQKALIVYVLLTHVENKLTGVFTFSDEAAAKLAANDIVLANKDVVIKTQIHKSAIDSF